MHCKLKIKSIETLVSLGLHDFEHESLQKVLWEIKIYYLSNPSFNDNIEEFISYVDIADALEEVCKKKQYKLIETLCYEAYQKLKSFIHHQISVSVAKEKIPDSRIDGSARFIITDKE
jgi:dihydroneopterin aldolase